MWALSGCSRLQGDRESAGKTATGKTTSKTTEQETRDGTSKAHGELGDGADHASEGVAGTTETVQETFIYLGDTSAMFDEWGVFE